MRGCGSWRLRLMVVIATDRFAALCSGHSDGSILLGHGACGRHTWNMVAVFH